MTKPKMKRPPFGGQFTQLTKGANYYIVGDCEARQEEILPHFLPCRQIAGLRPLQIDPLAWVLGHE